jgi:hypothetical protein
MIKKNQFTPAAHLATLNNYAEILAWVYMTVKRSLPMITDCHYITAYLATIGSGLEERVSALTREGKMLEGFCGFDRS